MYTGLIGAAYFSRFVVAPKEEKMLLIFFLEPLNLVRKLIRLMLKENKNGPIPRSAIEL